MSPKAAGSLLVMLMLAACGGGGGGGGGTDPVSSDPGVDGSPFVPLAVGDRWITSSEGTRYETRVVETRSTAFGTGHVLRTDDGGGSTQERILVKSGDGVRTVPLATDDAITRAIGPVQILRFPLRAGATHTAADVTANNLFDFDSDGRFDPSAVRIEVTVVGFEALTTVAGTFADTLHVRTRITTTTTLSSNAQRISVVTLIEDWYGRGIGVLRSQVTVDPGSPGAVAVEEVMQAWRVGANSSDSVAPTATSRTPTPGSVTQTAVIGFSFSEAMDRRSVGANGLRVQRANGTVIAGATEWVDDRSLRFVPAAGSLPSGAYNVSLAQTPEDLLGNRLAGDGAFSFTLDSRGPTLVSSSPAANAVDVALDTGITLTFDEAIAPATVNSLQLLQDGTVLPASTVVSGNRVTLTPSAALQRGLVYEVSINPGLTDTLGNAAPFATLRFTADPGRFALPVSLGSGSVRGLGLGDIDGDGVLDLLRSSEITPGDTGGLSAWRRAADGSRIGSSWQTLSSADNALAFLALSPSSFGVADLDQNGRPDLVFAYISGLAWLSQGTDSRWTLGNIQGPFVDSVQVLPPLDSGPPVIAFYGSFGVAPGLRVLSGVSSFGLPGELVSAGPNLQGRLLSGDFNGDSRIDLATVVGDSPAGAAGATGFRLLLALRRADGSFELREQALPAATALLRVVDLDGDGRLDLIARIGSSPMLSVLSQRAEGGFNPPRALSLVREPLILEVVDLDGDGRRDMVYMYLSGGARRLAWERQAADGSFVDTPLIEHARLPDLSDGSTLLVVDVSGDGRPDILVGNQLFVHRPIGPSASAALPARARLLGGRLPSASSR